MKYKHIIISGKVQNVSFREFVWKHAVALGSLSGYVRNTAEGNVEIVVQGEENKINKLIAYCKKGPLLADVRDVKIDEVEMEEEMDGFYVKHS